MGIKNTSAVGRVTYVHILAMIVSEIAEARPDTGAILVCIRNPT